MFRLVHLFLLYYSCLLFLYEVSWIIHGIANVFLNVVWSPCPCSHLQDVVIKLCFERHFHPIWWVCSTTKMNRPRSANYQHYFTNAFAGYLIKGCTIAIINIISPAHSIDFLISTGGNVKGACVIELKIRMVEP